MVKGHRTICKTHFLQKCLMFTAFRRSLACMEPTPTPSLPRQLVHKQIPSQVYCAAPSCSRQSEPWIHGEIFYLKQQTNKKMGIHRVVRELYFWVCTRLKLDTYQRADSAPLTSPRTAQTMQPPKGKQTLEQMDDPQSANWPYFLVGSAMHTHRRPCIDQAAISRLQSLIILPWVILSEILFSICIFIPDIIWSIGYFMPLISEIEIQIKPYELLHTFCWGLFQPFSYFVFSCSNHGKLIGVRDNMNPSIKASVNNLCLPKDKTWHGLHPN